MSQPLLTIAIPTYNRALLLKQCLGALRSQLNEGLKQQVEFIVHDNASADNTAEIVDGFKAAGNDIAYYKNDQNLGPDRNIAACFLKAKGKYVWIFSDDDFLLPGYLRLIVELLDKEDLGSVYLSSLWYSGDFTEKVAVPTGLSYQTFTDPLEFVGKVNYWTSFITGNIVNKNLFADSVNIPDFYDSSLVQLSWILTVIFKSRPNIVISDAALACMADNTGGYKLLKVFGGNFNALMDRLIAAGLIDKRVKRLMNRHLLNSFFPMFINKPGKSFEKENPFKIMVPVFWNYRSFWLKVFPVLFKNQYLKKCRRLIISSVKYFTRSLVRGPLPGALMITRSLNFTAT